MRRKWAWIQGARRDGDEGVGGQYVAALEQAQRSKAPNCVAAVETL